MKKKTLTQSDINYVVSVVEQEHKHYSLKRTHTTYKIKDLINGYKEEECIELNRPLKVIENDVVGRIVINPPTQRAYVAEQDTTWCNEIMTTIRWNNLLPEISLSVRGYRIYYLHDGQQRVTTVIRCIVLDEFPLTISTPKLGNVMFYWSELPDEIKNLILEYEVDVKIVEGNDDAISKGFERINLPGHPMTVCEALLSKYDCPFTRLLDLFWGAYVEDKKIPVPNFDGEYYNDPNSKFYLGHWYKEGAKDGYEKGGAITRGNHKWFILKMMGWYKQAKNLMKNKMLPIYCQNREENSSSVKKSKELVENYLKECVTMTYQQATMEIIRITNILNDFIQKASRLCWDEKGVKEHKFNWRDHDFTQSQAWERLYPQYMLHDKNLLSNDSYTYDLTNKILTYVRNVNSYTGTSGMVEYVLRGMKPGEEKYFCKPKPLSPETKDKLYDEVAGYDILTFEHFDKDDFKTYRFEKPCVGGLTTYDNVFFVPERTHTILSQGKTITIKEVNERLRHLRAAVYDYRYKNIKNVSMDDYIKKFMTKQGCKVYVEKLGYDKLN